MADGSSQEYLCEHHGFHHAKGKSLETKWCSFAKKTCKKDKRMRAVFPAKRTAEKAGTLYRTFFLYTHFTNAAERQVKQSFKKYVFLYPTCIL